MKISHWVLKNNSGMFNTAASMAESERVLGVNSIIVDCQDPAAWKAAEDTDLNVFHTHIDDQHLHNGKPMVWIAHGTPEVMFHSGFEQGTVNGAYGHGDAWMMAQFWLQHCDAAATFWPRHQKIWKSLSDKKTAVHCVPMGIDTDFWKSFPSSGKFSGSPSVFTAENNYEIKWGLDLFLAWPWIVEAKGMTSARLHAIYVPKDQHRWWFPLVNRNGCSFHAYIGPHVFNRENMRNALCSTDFYIGLVRYGDFNRMSLEANAVKSAKTISYRGNPYSDYWITEGDQRVMAQELLDILGGKIEPRKKDAVPSLEETAVAMKAIYESVL